MGHFHICLGGWRERSAATGGGGIEWAEFGGYLFGEGEEFFIVSFEGDGGRHGGLVVVQCCVECSASFVIVEESGKF